MFRSLTILAVALSCTGCGGQSLQDKLQAAAAERQRLVEAAIAECERAHPGRTKKPVMPRVRCMNEAQVQNLSRTDPNKDLVHALAAEILLGHFCVSTWARWS
jgi:hypothetical protein